MTLNELEDFLVKMNYIKENKQTYSKLYNMYQNVDSPNNLLTITYKINKGHVVVYNTTNRNKTKTHKAKLKNLFIKDESLHGLISLRKD